MLMASKVQCPQLSHVLLVSPPHASHASSPLFWHPTFLVQAWLASLCLAYDLRMSVDHVNGVSDNIPCRLLARVRKLIKVIKVSQNERAGQFNGSREDCGGLFSWRQTVITLSTVI